MPRSKCRSLSQWTTVALVSCQVVVLTHVALIAGCNSPVETIPALPSSGTTWTSGTTDPIESDVGSEPISIQKEIDLQQANYDQLNTTVAEFPGRVVVVDIWSTSCARCMQEFPHLVELATRYADQVACISMNIDYIGLRSKPAESYLPRIKAFLAEHATPGAPTAITHLAASETDEVIREKLGIESIPAVLVYDRAGQLVKKLTDANSSGVGLSYKNDISPIVADLVSRGQ